jgi:drug/metabolite transporter (DMT)-like permease
MPNKKDANRFAVRVLALSGIMIVSGAALSLCLKYQDRDTFRHPFLMVQEVFLGELLALFWLVCPLLRSRKKLMCVTNQSLREVDQGKRTVKGGRFWVGLGGLFDAVSSCFQIIGLVFLPTHLYLLSKNATIIFTVLFSVLILHTRLSRQQWLSLLAIVAGLLVVASSRVFGSHEPNTTFDRQTLFGLFVMMISGAITGFQLVYQEHLFRHFALEPRELVGLEGLFGCVVMTGVLVGSSFMECENSLICELGRAVDSPGEAVLSIWNDKYLLFAVYVSVLSSLLFNVCGASLVKSNSAIFRMIVDSYRTVVAWFLVLLLNLSETKPLALLFQACGTVLLIVGNYLYSRGTPAEPQPLAVSLDSFQLLRTQ